MREILFRGKRLDNNKWVEGYYMPLGERFHYIFTGKLDIVSGFPMFEHFLIASETVGRYTGLTDKNGVKIFEGDILHFINTYLGMKKEWLCVVDFIDAAFVCRYADGNWYLGEYNHFGSWNAPAVQWDVIGNIHDNPKLLKGDIGK